MEAHGLARARAHLQSLVDDARIEIGPLFFDSHAQLVKWPIRAVPLLQRVPQAVQLRRHELAVHLSEGLGPPARRRRFGSGSGLLLLLLLLLLPREKIEGLERPERRLLEPRVARLQCSEDQL